MTWLTWRQFRTSGMAVFAGIAALAAVLALTGPGIAHDYTSGLASCTAHGGCSSFTNRFLKDHENMYVGLVAIVLFLPAIIGLFWGAPLVTRELEAGTHRLVWNQTITRTRWLAVKLVIVGLAATVAAGLTGLAVSWWSSPIDKVATKDYARLSPLMFDARGIAPIGYAAFAFVLGVTVGILVRRTLPAIAVTLVVFAVVQLFVPRLVRPHLAAPTQVNTTITADNVGNFLLKDGSGLSVSVEVSDPGAWVLANRTTDRTGRTVGSIPISGTAGACAPRPPTGPEQGPPVGRECFDKIRQLGYRQHVSYQPASHFWTLQWYETTGFLALSGAMAGFCFWWLRRRVS